MKNTRRLLILAASVVGAAGLATAGWAYWSAGGSGSASAGVGTLHPPTNVSASATPGSGTVPVSWTASDATAPAVPPTGYYVERFVGQAPTMACGSPTSPLTGTSCNDSSVPDGTYTYRVTAVFRSWTAHSAPSGSVTVVNDATPPSVVSINRAAASPTNAADVAWTVTFTEAVSGVDAADFSLARGAGLSGASITTVSGSDTTWTVTAATGTGSGTLGLNLVDDDTIADAASNKLGGVGSGNGNFTGDVYSIDKAAPTVLSITRSGSSPTNATSVSWTVTFSESVTGADEDDFMIAASSGITGAEITSAGGETFTVLAGTGSGDGTLGLNLAASPTIFDPAGNALIGLIQGANEGYTIDKTKPTVTINQAAGQADPTNTPPINFTVTFSEPVFDFTDGDVNLTGTALGAAAPTKIVTGGPTIYNVAVSQLTSGTVSAFIPAGGAQDEAGNGNVASTSTDNTVTLDVTAPTVTVNQKTGQADPTNALPIRFTVTFSEPVTGFSADDLTRTGTTTGGTVELSGTGTSYEIALSGTLTNGTVAVSIPAGAAQDAVGNSNVASTSTDNSVTYDTTPPAGLTLTSPANNATMTDTTPTFAGAKGNLASDEDVVTVNIYVGSQTIGEPVQSFTVTQDGGSWSGDLPGGQALAEGTYTAQAVQEDVAGNSGSSTGTTFTISIPPYAQAIHTVGDADGRIESGEKIVLTFSEAMNPGSIMTGWSGSLQAVNVRIQDGSGGNNDSLSVDGANLGTIDLATKQYTADSTVSASISMTPDGRVITILLNEAAGGTVTPEHRYTWKPSAAAKDLAGGATRTDLTPITDGATKFPL